MILTIAIFFLETLTPSGYGLSIATFSIKSAISSSSGSSNTWFILIIWSLASLPFFGLVTCHYCPIADERAISRVLSPCLANLKVMVLTSSTYQVPWSNVPPKLVVSMPYSANEIVPFLPFGSIHSKFPALIKNSLNALCSWLISGILIVFSVSALRNSSF